MSLTYHTSLDPALAGSIMRWEGSNILRCKPCFNNCTPKKGLHLEIFDPSGRMIELGKAGSKLVPVVGGNINILDDPQYVYVFSYFCNWIFSRIFYNPKFYTDLIDVIIIDIKICQTVAPLILIAAIL